MRPLLNLVLLPIGFDGPQCQGTGSGDMALDGLDTYPKRWVTVHHQHGDGPQGPCFVPGNG